MKRFCLLLSAVLVAANLSADEAGDQVGGWSLVGVAPLPFRYLEWPSPDCDVTGLRLGVISRHHAVAGFDIGAVVNYADADLCGLGLAPINSHGGCYGLQAGLVNATGHGSGLQIGFWNMAEEFSGLQIGVVNFAHRLCGVQIGLGDVITESPFPVSIILNACF